MTITTEDYIIKLKYCPEWFQADAKVNIPSIDEKKFFGGLELIKMLNGKNHVLVRKALKHSIHESLKMEQKERRLYREQNKVKDVVGIIPIV